MEEIGERLGRESLEQVVANVERYCHFGRERIELTNRSPLAVARAELCLLAEQKDALERRLRAAPPVGDLRTRRRRARCYWAVASVLVLAGFYFSALTFDAFRLGAKPYLYCAGIAIGLSFLGDLFLAVWGSQKLVAILVSVAFLAVISSVGILAVIRGDLFIEELKSQAAVSVVDDDAPQSAPARNTFYEDTAGLLQVAMLLISVGIDLAAGLAVREALRYGAAPGEDPSTLAVELRDVNQQLVGRLEQAVALESEPARFEARLWQDFYRSLLTHATRSAMTKLLVGVLAVLLTAEGRVVAQSHTRIVIAVDLTQSVAVRVPDQKSEFQKNIDAITKQLAQIPADSRVTIFGITDHSFTQPDILLSAALPADAGYFGERLNTARRELVRAWKARSAKLEPRYRHTDIIGALVLTGQLFDEHPDTNQKILVIFSDMRETGPVASPSSQGKWSLSRTGEWATTRVADLEGVLVYALGVDGAGKPIAYWQSLREFWREYFRGAGALLKSYSVLREPPELEPPVAPRRTSPGSGPVFSRTP